MASAGDQLAALHQRLWTALCELRSESSIENQRLTLVITGPQLSAANILLTAYQALALKRQWNFQTHALLPRDHNNSSDRVIDCDGWSSDPSFRISTAKVAEDFETAILGLLNDADKPKLAAYKLLRFAHLTSFPPGTVGLMLTFRGEAAALMMSGEVGVHTFSRLNQPKSTGSSRC